MEKGGISRPVSSRRVSDFVTDDKGRIDFDIVRSSRKTLGIHIGQGGQVLVKAPAWVSRSQIREAVLGKSPWIREKADLARRGDALKITHRFAQGEPFLYLGRTYPLYIRYDPAMKNVCVDLTEDEFVIETPAIHGAVLEMAVLKWYRENALKLMEQRVQYYGQIFGALPSKVIVREQKSRWGSCNSKGELRLNWKLIMAPPGILDYVVVHELCHLKEMNHSPRFWNLVETLCPQYRQCRQWLKDYGAALSWNCLETGAEV